MERKSETLKENLFKNIKNDEMEWDEVAAKEEEDILIKINVPGDGSCLFWAVTMAYLLPVRNNENLFSERCVKLFGVENVNKTLHVQKLMQNHTFHYVYEDETLIKLVVKTFRHRVIDELLLRKQEVGEEVHRSVTLNDFLHMRNEAFIIDGTFRDQFQSAFPSQTHLVDFNTLKPQSLNESSINALNVELDKISDNNKVQKFKFSAYLSAMRSCKSWAGELEIRAIQNLLNCSVLVITNGGTNLPLIINQSSLNIYLFLTNQTHYEFGLVKSKIILKTFKNTNYELALSLIKIGVENINYQDEDGWTMLHYAVVSDNYENIINQLLWQSADLTLKNKDNKTALELAEFLARTHAIIAITNFTQSNFSTNLITAELDARIRVKLVELSKSFDFKINVETIVERSIINTRPKGQKCNEECAKIMDSLCSNNGIEMHCQAFLSAVINNDVKMVEFLIKNESAGVTVKSFRFHDIGYGSPLHYAAQKGYINIARVLVVDGRAKVDLKDKRGAAPLQKAVQYGHVNVVKFLIQNGANVNFVDNERLFSLINAIQAGYDHIVDYLLEKGAEVNWVDANGMSPLHHAVQCSRWNAVKCLVEHEAVVNQVNKNNKTPLSIVIEKNNWDIAKYLLENGALLIGLAEKIKTEIFQRFIENVDRDLRLQHAIALGNVELLEILIKTHSLDYENVFEIYNQFRLCNVKLSSEMCIFIENKLMSFDFYSDNRITEEENTENLNIENVKRRLKLVINCIDQLENDFSRVNDLFLFVGKFVANNMQILKRQLSFSYDLIPWEEMHFCLINFLLRYVEPSNVDVSISLVLCKNRILKHLSIFKNALLKLDVDELNSSKKSVKNREIIKSKIVSLVPEFHNLYEDFEQLKDLHSLMKIEWHLKVACAVDLKNKPEIGQLVIERALQVTGECLKNTKNCPNLSQKIQDELINFAPINVKNTITTLRDALSHVETLSERINTIDKSKNKNHFLNIQKNLLKFKRDITRLLYTKKIEICKLFLRRIMACKSADEVEALVSDLKISRALKININDEENCEVYERIKKYVLELRKLLRNNNNNDYLDQFDVIINRIQRKNPELQKVHAYLLDEIGSILKSFKRVQNVRVIRRKIKLLLGDYVDFDTDSFAVISMLLSALLSEAIPTCSHAANVVVLKLLKSIQFEVRKIKAIEEFKSNLRRKSSPMIPRANHHAEPSKTIDKQLRVFLRTINNPDWRKQIECEYRMKKDIFLAKNELIKYFNREIKLSEKDFSALLEKVNFKMLKTESVSALYRRENDGLKIENIIQRIKDPFGQLVHALIMSESDVAKQARAFFKIFKSVKRNNLIFEERNKQTRIILEKYYFEKLGVLERVLHTEIRDSELLRLLRTNDELRLAVEMLLLTLTEILETLSPLETNSKYLDEICPVLVGRNLRNYLAHGDLLIHLLSIDHLKSIIFHVRAMQKNHSLTEFRFHEGEKICIEKKTIASISELEMKYRENYFLLMKQQKLIETIKDNNNLENIKNFSGLELKYRQTNGCTLLYSAAEKVNLELFKTLLKDNLNIYYRDKFEHSILFHLVKFNSHVILKYLIEHHHVHPNIALKKGKSLLHFSAKFGHIELTEWLLSIGVNVDDTDDAGMSPIQYAVINEHVNIVSALIKTNAALFTFGQCEKTVFQLKSLVVNPHVLRLIMREIDISFKTVILHAACRFGYLPSVKLLLENYVDINAALDENGQTPLTIAVTYSHLEIVKFLLEHGAAANLVASAANNTALHVAAMKDNLKVAQLLIEKGADVNIKNRDGISPLHLASLAGNLNIVKLLLVEGAHQNHAPDDPSPLFYAAQRNHTQTFRLLLTHYSHLKVLRKTRGVNALLHVAALTGNVKILRTLLERDFNINLPNIDGNTPLHLAVLNNKVAAVKKLLQYGADVNFSNNVGSTPLHITAITGHVEILKLLIDSNAKFVGNHACCTPLHVSVAFGQEQTAETLIYMYRSIESKENYGLTALNLAAFSGQNRMVDLLLELKADVNSTDNHNRSALHHAALNGYYSIAKKLIEKNARLDIQDVVDGSTALHLAVDKKHTRVVKLLCTVDKSMTNLRNYYGEKPVHIAAQNGNYAAVKLLLGNGENVDAQSEDGYTALHYAVINEHSNIVELLLGYGADVDIKCSVEGYRSLQLSAIHGRQEIVQMLLKNGADANDKEAFFIAVANGRAAAVNILLRNGADVNATMKGENALHLAAKFGYEIIAEILLKYGANAEAVDERRDTPLHRAAFYGHHQILNIFHKHKMSVNVINSDNNWPLHLAVEQGHSKCVEYLLNFGADIQAVYKNGNTALHAAAFKGHLAVVRALLGHQNSVNIVNETDQKGQTALHLVALTNNIHIAELLIKAGANVNIPTKNTLLPLHLAFIRGSLEMVKLLLESGTNMNIELTDKSEFVYTTLHCAVKFINPKIKYIFVNNFYNNNAIDERDALKLQAKCNERILELIFDKIKDGTEMNARDSNGDTPLHWAVKYGNLHAVKLLLNFDEIEINARNFKRCTALHLAARRGDFGAVEALINGGADVFSTDDHESVLHVAAVKSQEILELVLKEMRMKADGERLRSAMNAADGEGDTPLMWAVEKGNLGAVKMLVECEEMEINRQNAEGWTALHWAVQLGHLVIVNLLVRKNANAGIVDRNQETALDIANKNISVDEKYKFIAALILSKIG